MATTWNPSDKDASITLSNGNLTADSSILNQFRSVRSTTSKSSGKVYFEIKITNNPGGESTWMGGIMTANANLVGYPGSDTNGVGAYPWYGGGGLIYYNSSGNAAANLNTGPGSMGKTVGIAFDIDSRLFWGTVDGTHWNNTGTDNPATGSGGFSVTPTGPFFIGWGGGFNTDGDSQATIQPDAASFAFAVPSGFAAWDPAAGAALTADIYGVVEFSRALRRDLSSQVEFSLALIGGTNFPVEALAGEQRDFQNPAEMGAVTASDRACLVDFETRLASGAPSDVEWLSQAATNRNVVSEWIRSSLLQMATPSAFAAALADDRPVPVEFQRQITAGLTADRVLPIEWLALPAIARVSLASPSKRRILGTPGRLRLLKRQ
jgi:hypothetical protein